MPSFESLVAELAELIAIPSVSADPAHQADVAAAAEWVADRVRRAGGSAEVIPWGERPLVVGEIRASRSAETAPTILCYGHFDVQPPDPLELWESRSVRARRARRLALRPRHRRRQGAAVHAAEGGRAARGGGRAARQPPHSPATARRRSAGTRSSTGSQPTSAAPTRRSSSTAAWSSATCPGFNIAVRGVCYFHVKVRTGARDLHSGMYGGASLNAMHALMQTLVGRAPARRAPARAVARRGRGSLAPPSSTAGSSSRRAPPRSPRPARARPMLPRPRSSTSAPGPSRRSTCTASRAARRSCRRR